MRHLEITGFARARTSEVLFPLLCDFEAYPRFSDTVVSLTVDRSKPGEPVSQWTIQFGPGEATWTQRDSIEPATKSIHFERLSGDIEEFRGFWKMEDTPEGCRVLFSIYFDTGLFLLSAIVDPMVENVLRDNIASILRGLCAAEVVTA